MTRHESRESGPPQPHSRHQQTSYPTSSTAYCRSPSKGDRKDTNKTAAPGIEGGEVRNLTRCFANTVAMAMTCYPTTR
jgi:hypothetical protein